MAVLDERNIAAGRLIPTEGYADQPYIVKTDDGAWLCVVTTGAGVEGQPGQHVISLRSVDQGRTWSTPVDVEPAGGPEASYAVPLKAPSGRVYCFYNHNTDNVREVVADDPPFKGGRCRRVDSLGHYVFKYSDDHGRTWSEKRYVIPVREMEIDRRNPYAGKLRFFWNVGRPFTHEAAAYVPLHKVGGFGQGFFTRSEGVLLRSRNLPAEGDPERIEWETLPDGDAGLRTPPGGGPVSEEQSCTVLSDGSLYCVYRSIDGHPVCAYSRDGGRTWSRPEYQRYADGRLMKHPRAANFVWRCANGKYLYWFHNHGGRFIRESADAPNVAYEDRNPAWLCGGVEADGPGGRAILWSQPEIVLYDDDPCVRISYPDLVEDRGSYFLTETQKNLARVHEIDPALLEGLWGQFDPPGAVADRGLLLELPSGGCSLSGETAMPKLPAFCARDHERPDYGTKHLRSGFTVELWARFDSLAPGQVLLDSRAENGRGQCLQTTKRGTVEIILNDGRTENRWDCDSGALAEGGLHHVAVVVDGGPRIITFVVDGRLCDGGAGRQFGWGRFSPNLRDAVGGPTLRVGPAFRGQIRRLRIYDRRLRTSEAVAHHHAGPDAAGAAREGGSP